MTSKPTTIHVRVTPSQAERLREAAKRDGRSLSGFVRHAAEKAAEKQKQETATKNQ